MALIREVLAPVMSVWRAFLLGAFHSLVYLTLTLGLGAWLL